MHDMSALLEHEQYKHMILHGLRITRGDRQRTHVHRCTHVLTLCADDALLHRRGLLLL